MAYITFYFFFPLRDTTLAAGFTNFHRTFWKSQKGSSFALISLHIAWRRQFSCKK